MSRLVFGEQVPFYQMGMGNSLVGIMWPELEDDHTSMSDIKVTNAWSIASTYPI